MDEWYTFTKKVVDRKTCYTITIPADIIRALDIKPDTIVEVKIKKKK